MAAKIFKCDAIPLASDETKKDYLRQGDRIVAMAERHYPDYPNQPLKAVRALFHARKSQYRPSSTRAFKQQAFSLIDREVARGAVPAIDEEYQKLLMSTILQNCRGRPEARTSAKKVKDMTLEEYIKIRTELENADLQDPISKALYSMVLVGPFIGLRPCEWLNATFANGRLKIKNAKATNGRAPGESRQIDIRKCPEQIVGGAFHLAKTMRRLLVSHGGEWRNLLKILAERLARACKRIGIRRLSPYSLRDAAIASWKRAGLSPAEIAALAGHASLKTADRHYAGAHHGWSPDFAVAKPSRAIVVWILDRAARSAPPQDPPRAGNPLSPLALPRPETPKTAAERVVALPEVGSSADEQAPTDETAWVPGMR
jgi:integrase